MVSFQRRKLRIWINLTDYTDYQHGEPPVWEFENEDAMVSWISKLPHFLDVVANNGVVKSGPILVGRYKVNL
ncbi:hypothetical protein GD1_224 [Paraglaciecola Antarctic GD virus 1]|nr:hypothetical protein GD1_224 [Paraglaciecola Antarctic GD virus 1]